MRVTIGPKMSLAIDIVQDNPGCTKKYVAERISPHPTPHRNWGLGYDPINRAIKAGLIKAECGGGRYRLYVDNHVDVDNEF